MPFVATGMDSEIVIRSEEVRHRKTNMLLYVESKKDGTNELTYKIEIESEM